MDLHARYPGPNDLKEKAKRRIPHFVFEYLDSGTGAENTLHRNREQLDAVRLLPSILHGPLTPDLSVSMFGQSFPLPFGIAPVGMSGLIWPDAEYWLARAATEAGIPYCMSTVASQAPEYLSKTIRDNGWFQLYPPRDPAILDDMLARIRNAGFNTLVLTVDVPVASRRERQVRSGLTQPPRLTPRLIWQIARRPAWAMGMMRMGMPRMRFLDAYSQDSRNLPPTEHLGYLLRTSPDMAYLRRLREAWDGPLVVKGVLDPDMIPLLQSASVDALWVSNHAGRQFDGAPSAIEMLPSIRASTKLPIIIDSGFVGGLDILRAMALGADFVMMGRTWHYALGALGASGPAHLVDILTRDLEANMGQLGLAALKDAHTRLFRSVQLE